MLQSFTIDDNLEAQVSRAIEVTLLFDGGVRRWCYFMRVEALMACGDWIDGTQTRVHYGAPHMIVVAGALSREVIELALKHIEAQGELEQCSLPLGSSSSCDGV
jgi:hypothetical protein